MAEPLPIPNPAAAPLPRIGVVILNWNKRDDLLRCLTAVAEQTLPPVRVLVVDNASSDGSVAAVRAAWPEVELLVHGENLGGTAGFNSGIRRLLEDPALDSIHLLDNDATLEPEALAALAAALAADGRVAVAGSKLLVTGSAGRLQELGAHIDWERFHLAPVGQGQYDGPDFQTDRQVDYVPACSALLRAAALREVGLMDEGNFLYWDDIEWGWRFNRMGWRVVAVAGSRAWHKMGSADRPSPLTTYYFWRNRLRFFNRHAGGRQWLRFIARYARELHDALFSCAVAGKRGVALALWEATRHALTGRRGRSPRPGWPPDRRRDEALRRELAAATRLWLAAGEGAATEVEERLRRSFGDRPLPRYEGTAAAGEWVVGAVGHVLAGELPRSLPAGERVVLADRFNNLLRWDRRGRLLRAAYRLSRALLLPAAVALLLPAAALARYLERGGVR